MKPPRTKGGQDTQTDTTVKTDTDTKVDTDTKIKPKTTTITAQKPKQDTRPRQRPRPHGFPRPKARPKPPKIPLLLPLPDGDGFGRRGLGGFGTSKGSYKAFYKKGNKFFPISKVPVKKSMALSQGAFVIDKSLARTFKVVKVSGKQKKPVVVVPNNYFPSKAVKFRNYRISKGKKVSLKNTFIEKRKFGLDTSSEVRKIQARRIIAQRTKKFFKPSRRLTRRK